MRGAGARPELAIHASDPVAGPGTGGFIDHDTQGIAATARAGHLDEGDVVAPSEEADPVGRDGLATGGAVDPARERIEVVARIHRPQVYRVVPHTVLARSGRDRVRRGCDTIPPGGIIGTQPTPWET